MTHAQLRTIIDIYIAELERYPPVKMDTSQYCGDLRESPGACERGFGHIRWMLDQMKTLIAPDRIQDQDLQRQIREEVKLQRWLGFIQGVLFAGGLFAIDELREHVTGAQKL